MRWTALPDAVAERILQQAFAEGSCSVRDWVTLSLVCRTWKDMMLQSPASVEIPPQVTYAHIAWLRATQVPIRRMVFMEDPVFWTRAGWADDQAQRSAACQFKHISRTIADNLEELESISLPEPEHWTGAFLQQFRRLRTLSLLDDEGLVDDERELFVDNLPPSLQRLRMTVVSPVQGEDFDQLTHLRDFHLRLVVVDDEADWLCADTPEINIFGLPPSLKTLVVTSEEALAVTLAPAAHAPEPHVSAGASLVGGTGAQGDVVAAATRHVRLCAPEVELRSSPAGHVTGAATGLALVINAMDVVFELPPGVSTDGHDIREDCASQLRATVEHLAAWIACSSATSVQFEPRRTAADSAAVVFMDALRVSFKAGKRQGMRFGAVFNGANDLLRFMKPLCAQHRLSCSGGRASDGTAGGVLIERLL